MRRLLPLVATGRPRQRSPPVPNTALGASQYCLSSGPSLQGRCQNRPDPGSPTRSALWGRVPGYQCMKWTQPPLSSQQMGHPLSPPAQMPSGRGAHAAALDNPGHTSNDRTPSIPQQGIHHLLVASTVQSLHKGALLVVAYLSGRLDRLNLSCTN